MTAPSPAHAARIAFIDDVRRGLGGSPKRLPSRYFYDELGSQLFEAICQLPWYPITRAEDRLLGAHAADMIAPFPALAEICELGCGSGDKIGRLMAALDARGEAPTVHLIDVSPRAHELAQSSLSRFPRARVQSHLGTYEEGLAALPKSPSGQRLALFLGSNIGNFDPPAARALLAAIRRALRPGDGLLLGADGVRAEADLVLAYDDPLGVTAAFNKNLLQRLNAELGADFDLASFAHEARWNAPASRMEMHLVSRRAQRVTIPAAEMTARFHEGESIWTESSCKYTETMITDLGLTAGLTVEARWVDERTHFSTTLFRVR
ncbi:MAG: L-histidine N(alpha)-methyltransferase [Byssovorax sp.]